ncbi:MAG: diguanylate cyclase [gamma proteobacterium symbiont of Taylorina sp.]|nr:diguanylate cyclase [gamma proteobacterium symbiont of Taylorina sp.]
MTYKYLKTAKILYVEDDKKVREGYTKTLNRCAKELYVADDGEAGLELFKKLSIDIVVSDIKMPHMNGIDMAKAIMETAPDIPIVFTTAHNETSFLFEAIELQVDAYILKPVPIKTLMSKINKISKNILLEKVNKMQHAELQEQKNILQNIIDSEKNMLIVTDFNNISFVNNSFLDFFEIEIIEDFLKRYQTLFDIFKHNSLINSIDANIMKSDPAKAGRLFYELLKNTDEAKRIVTITDGLLKDKHYYINTVIINNNSNLYLVSLTDITKITIEKNDAEKKAYIDGLTGVYNRNKFEEVFSYELLRKERYSEPLSIAILDIDHFKEFNDNYGHLIGDEVLVMIADTLKRNIRKTDIFARWGGEEFVILFAETTLEDAIKTSDLLRKKIESLEHPIAGKITISFGVTEHREKDTSIILFKRCDEALYMAKEAGRNCIKSL